MGKLAPTSIKYIIKAHIKAKGVIEKPDVIGAVFGQTEGLLGPGLDLRELQRTGRIGRIEVNIKSSAGNSEGDIIIPSALDAAETSLIAATLETIDRVGPCTAEIQLVDVEDTRSMKRDYIVDRAKNILKKMAKHGAPDVGEVSEKIKESVRAEEISSYHGLPSGPKIEDNDEIIIVEGRADVLNLLRFGVKNVIAIEGTSVPQAVVSLAKEKTVTIFVDGDRGGELIVKELMQRLEADFIAQAPEGKEVEELSQKEVFKSLRSKVVAEQFLAMAKNSKREERPKRSYGDEPEERRQPSRARIKPEERELFKSTLEDLVGTRAACIFNSDGELLGRVPVAELPAALRTVDSPYAVVFDGKVDRDLEAMAKRKGVSYLVGKEKDNIRSSIGILDRLDLE